MRRQVYFLAFLVVLSLGAFGQSLVVSDLDDLVVDAPSTLTMKARATITNNSSSAIDVLIRFNEVLAGPTNSGHTFCWAVCYNEGTVDDGYVTPDNHFITIDAGASNSTSFYSDYFPNNTVGKATYEYCFFDKNNPSDETCVEIMFDTESVGVEELAKGTNGISEAYPNPAKSVAKVNYSNAADSKDAKLIVYGMLGSKVREVALTEERGTLKLDVSSLPSGMYFYSLLIDDKAISTKKMLVTK